MFIKTIITNSADETKDFAKQFASQLKIGNVVCLSGNLGAGKTQFVQGVANYFNVKDQVVSPTFNLMYQYNSMNIIIYHFDLYRLNSSDELEDIGFYETIDSGGISFIEWPEKFINCIPKDAIFVNIKKIGETKREISIKKICEKE